MFYLCDILRLKLTTYHDAPFNYHVMNDGSGYFFGLYVNKFFDWCVKVLENIGDYTGWGYLANIIIFVILQPALILLFFCLWIRAKIGRYNRTRQKRRREFI